MEEEWAWARDGASPAAGDYSSKEKGWSGAPPGCHHA